MKCLKLFETAFLLFTVVQFVACSGDVNTAGTLIETNTGNKVLIETNTGNGFARISMKPSDYDMASGDTLVLEMADRDTISDTLYVHAYKKVADSASIAKDLLELDSVSVGVYDSAEVRPVEGSVRTFAIDWEIQADMEYTLTDNHLQASDTDVKDSTAKELPVEDTTAVADTLTTDTIKTVYDTVSIALPEGFTDLADVDEAFKEMPLPLRLPAKYTKPCAYDINGEQIPLEKVNDSLYWGKMEQVVFSKSGTIDFAVLDNCADSTANEISLSRRTVHLDDKSASEAAAARFDDMTGVFGGALWTDSTDMWSLISNFEPFTNNGTQVSASIWIKGDSASQAYLPENKNYTRILSCKKDSVGFILQQRSNQAAVNLRIDARTNGKGVYNTAYGNARILDGEWHNYSFTIRGDSVYTYADGVKLAAKEFDSGEGFAACSNPAIGYENRNFVGGLDEIFFFDGSQSENWMRLFYGLQKQAMK